MKREQIIQMAREADCWEEGKFFVCNHDELERFAALVAEAERTRLANAIEAMPFGDTAASFAVWIREGGKV